MSPEGKQDITVGMRVSFPYGGSRRTGTVTDISQMPDGAGGSSTAYLIDVGSRKVFVQGEGITPATAPATPFDPVAEGVAYGRKRPRAPRRH
jgi:primosomal protein N'